MSKCDSCYHAKSCKKQAELLGAKKPAYKNCDCYEGNNKILDTLSYIMCQAKAGSEFFSSDVCANTWFSRIYILSDILNTRLTGEKLSDFTLNNPSFNPDLTIKNGNRILYDGHSCS